MFKEQTQCFNKDFMDYFMQARNKKCARKLVNIVRPSNIILISQERPLKAKCTVTFWEFMPQKSQRKTADLRVNDVKVRSFNIHTKASIHFRHADKRDNQRGLIYTEHKPIRRLFLGVTKH
jgi:hypothetical protein